MDRWVVRTRAGKLYGPLSTDRVVKKIHEGFFRGEEWIAVYPNGQWLSISKHPEFYDAFLEALNFSGGNRAQEEPSLPPEIEGEALEPQSADDDDPTLGEGLQIEEPVRKRTERSTRQQQKPPDHVKTKPPSSSRNPGEVIPLEKISSIQKRVRRRSFGKNIAMIVFALFLFVAVLLLLHSPSGDRIRLLRPTGIGQRTITAEDVERKWIQALSEFRLDTFQNYMNAQNRLVEMVEGEPRPLRALELLCMTYHSLWPFAHKNPADMETVQFAARSATQLDPTSRASDVCRAVELIMLGSYQEAEEHLQGVLRAHTEYV